MQDPTKPGLPETYNIDVGVFERINNSLMDLKRNFSQEGLIDQMIQMNKIMQSLVDQVSTSWDKHAENFSGSLTAHRGHLKAHDDHLSAHDGHLKTHSEYLESINQKLKSLGK